MTQERFIQFLENPEALSLIPYEELKTLTLAYPYAHNLRYLLALKSQQVQHPDEARNLAAAAAYSLNRTCLFSWVAMPHLAPQRVAEEVLELKPIESVREELEALSPLPKREVAEKQAFAAPVPPPPPVVSAAAEVEPAPVLAPPPPAPRHQPFEEWIGDFHPPVLQRPAPVSKHLAAPAPVLPVAEASAPARSIAQELAERSVAENQDVISETLARLLARQGYREKAIAMYERLSLAFPDKSSFFAAEIDKLKK